MSKSPPILLDTSAAIALVVRDHEHHVTTRAALDGFTLGLAGHAAFETYSVLTRLPAPARRTPSSARELIAHNFPATKHLDGATAARVLESSASHGIAGGAIYDALVAAAAAAHAIPLATRDRRALDTYAAMGAEVRLITDERLNWVTSSGRDRSTR